jgi:hypothetical protein
MHKLTDRTRPRSPSKGKVEGSTTPATTAPASTLSKPENHHLAPQSVVSADGLTFISPPWLAGVPVVSHMALAKPALTKPKPPKDPKLPSPVFVNPILSGFHDEPSIARAGDNFFLTTTSGEYYPGLPIYHTKDLVSWTLLSHALTRKSQLDLGTEVEAMAGVRRPSLRYRDGVFYLLASFWRSNQPDSKVSVAVSY